MYRIDVLINLKWKYLYENEDLHAIDIVVFGALKEGKQIRILKDNILLTFLNTIEEYDYWKMLISMRTR